LLVKNSSRQDVVIRSLNKKINRRTAADVVKKKGGFA